MGERMSTQTADQRQRLINITVAVDQPAVCAETHSIVGAAFQGSGRNIDPDSAYGTLVDGISDRFAYLIVPATYKDDESDMTTSTRPM